MKHSEVTDDVQVNIEFNGLVVWQGAPNEAKKYLSSDQLYDELAELCEAKLNQRTAGYAVVSAAKPDMVFTTCPTIEKAAAYGRKYKAGRFKVRRCSAPADHLRRVTLEEEVQVP